MTAVLAVVAAVGEWFAGLSAVGQALVQIGGSLLLQAAAKEFMPTPDAGLQGRTVTVRQPVQPRDIVYGQTRKGGTLVYLDEAGQANEFLDLVIVVAAHKILGIGGVYFNGQMVFAPGSGVAVGQYAGYAEIETRLGDPDQPSLTVLTNVSGGKWTVNHRLRGCAHVWIRLRYSADVFPGGIPNITFDIAGKSDVYDPRNGLRDYTENAALCLADYMSDTTFGIGAAIGAIDGLEINSLIAAANICDEVVARPEGGTERRYTCNGVISLSQAPKAIIESLLTAMAGRAGWQSGAWQIFAGAYLPPTITLTDDDIAEGGMQLTTRVSQAENFNAVRGQFVSPVNDWQPDDFPAYVSGAYLLEDGGEQKFADISLPFTISASMAQRLAKITLERQRRQMSVVLSGKLTAWRAAVGDTVNLTYARWGFASKPFEVRSVELALSVDGGSPRLVPTLVLRETSPLVYDWSVGEADVYLAAPRTTLPSPFRVPAPSAVQVSEQLYQTLAGAGVKALARVSWYPAPSAFVAQYQVDAKRGAGPWQLVGRTEDTTIDLLDIAPGDWSFRVKSISQAGVSSSYGTCSQEIFGLGAPPSALANVTVQTAGGLAVLKWDRHPDLDVQVGGRIVIRHSTAAIPSWSSSVGMDEVAGSQGLAVVPQKAGTYLLRAEDAGGVSGPVSMVTISGFQAIAFTALTTLAEEPGFSGGKTGVTLGAGGLQLDSSSPVDLWADFDAVLDFDAEGGILPTGTYDFSAIIDLASIKLVRLRSVIDLSILEIGTTIEDRLGDIDTWASFDGADGGEVDVVVEVRTTPDDPAGSPVWGAWGRVDSTEVRARGIQARAMLTTKDAAYSPMVTKLQLIAEEVL